MASYKQLSKQNWQVVICLGYDESGKKKRVKKQGFKTKGAAEKYAAAIVNDNQLLHTPGADIYYKDFVTKWFNEYKVLNISINTKNDYSSRINSHIIPLLGSYKLRDINTAVMQDFYNKLIGEKGMKPISAKKVFDIVVGSFKYAKKLKLIKEMPTDIEKIKAEKPQIEFWTKEEIDFFLNEIKDDYLYIPILICVLTGVRVGELCGLRWCDVDFENGSITINHQVVQDKVEKTLILSNVLKTSTSHRTITIPQILIDKLIALKNENNDTSKDFVIKDRNGSMCNPRNVSMNFTKKVKNYSLSLDDMKIKYPKKDLSNYRQLKQISIHSLRHTHATLLIFNGENIKVVSDRLGHKDINITLNTYTHIMEEMKKDTAKLLDNLFSPSISS